MEQNSTNQNENCEPVEVTDKKTGLRKIMYLCKKPVQKRVQHYKENKLHFWTDLGLIATIIILIGVIISLWIFNNYLHQNIVNFEIDYKTEELINGQRVNFTVNYQNISQKPISNGQVIVRFPQGLLDQQINDPRYNQKTNTVTIGNLEPGQGGDFTVSGLMLSDLGSIEKFVFVFNYDNHLGQPQQEFTSREFVVEKSIVKMDLQLPPKIIIGSQFPTTISYTNLADYPLDNLKLKLIFPQSYQTQDGQIITLESLNPQESGTKEVFGTITQGVPSDLDFIAVILYPFQGQDFVLSKVTKKNKVDFSKLLINFLETEKNQNITPGDQTIIKFRLQNQEEFDLQNMQVELKLSGDYLDQTFLEKKYPEQFKNNILKLPIQELKAGESKDFEITLNTRQFILVNAQNQGPQDLRVAISASYENQPNHRIFISSSTLTIPINSKLFVKPFGLFYTNDGDQIGVGSLPPRVGEYTAYWAVIRITNSVNKVRNVKMTANLPKGVEFTGTYNVTQGAPIRQLADKKTIEWFIPEILPYAGNITPAPEARILLAITPNQNQVGQILPLLTNIKISAIDERTGHQLSTSAPDITTAIFDDQDLNKVVP